MIRVRFLCLMLFVSMHGQAQPVADKQKVMALLSKMTLEEKVGQMTQVTLGVVGTNKDGVLNPVSLRKAILDYKVGSILNVTGHALTVDEWHIVNIHVICMRDNA